MYDPAQDGLPRGFSSVRYFEAPPPLDLSDLIHSFWELKTVATLPADFHYLALPDACVNVVFNQLDPRIAGITALRTTAAVLNLGSSFHYIGIQFFPGVWQGRQEEVVDSYVGEPYRGRLPLVATNERAKDVEFEDKTLVLADLVRWASEQGLVAANAVTRRILERLDDIHSVSEMAEAAGLSTRQLRRHCRGATGLPPHDFLKVLRLQRTFRTNYLDVFADQSHYIHAFRNATGYTPTKYRSRFRDQPSKPGAIESGSIALD